VGDGLVEEGVQRRLQAAALVGQSGAVRHIPQDRQLGAAQQQLDQVGTGELVARIDEPSRQNVELTAERDALARGKAKWEETLAEAEEDRDAARASLRRMTRMETTNPGAPKTE
jgi:hypothetical protein